MENISNNFGKRKISDYISFNMNDGESIGLNRAGTTIRLAVELSIDEIRRGVASKSFRVILGNTSKRAIDEVSKFDNVITIEDCKANLIQVGNAI